MDPASTGEFSEAHDQGIWQCLCNILQIDPIQAQTVKDIASLASRVGRSRAAQCKTDSCASPLGKLGRDCIPMIRARHPTVAEQLVRQLEGHPATTCLHEAASPARSLDGMLGWSPPSWRALANGERPDMRQPEGIRAWHATRGLATRSGISGGTTLQRCRFVSKVERSRGGACAITSRTWCKACTRHVPDVSHHVTGAPTLPGAPPPSLAPPSSLLLALLAVWPTTRPMWPPGSLRAGLGSWGGASTLWRASQLVSAARLVPG